MQNYIEQALRSESKPDQQMMVRLASNARLIHAAFGLQTEPGEFADALKRHVFYGTPLDMRNVEEEVGDILWYLAIVLDVCGTTFERCMEANIRKLKARYPEKFDAEKAVNRNLEKELSALSEDDFQQA